MYVCSTTVDVLYMCMLGARMLTHYSIHCSLQSFDDRTDFCQQVPRLEPSQPQRQQPIQALWLPLPQQLRQPCLFSPAPPLHPDLATVPQWSSDSNRQPAILEGHLIGTATSGNPLCLAPTVQGRNGESWKERYCTLYICSIRSQFHL